MKAIQGLLGATLERLTPLDDPPVSMESRCLGPERPTQRSDDDDTIDHGGGSGGGGS